MLPAKTPKKPRGLHSSLISRSGDRALQRDTPTVSHVFTQTKATSFPRRQTAVQRRKQPKPAKLPTDLEALHSPVQPGPKAVIGCFWVVLAVAAVPGATRRLRLSCHPTPVLLLLQCAIREQTFHPTRPPMEGPCHSC